MSVLLFKRLDPVLFRGSVFDGVRERLGMILFFFQAEDGIRDLTVTGVQTCALPIYDVVRDSRSVQRLVNRVSVEASFFKKMSSGRTCRMPRGSTAWARPRRGRRSRSEERRVGEEGRSRWSPEHLKKKKEDTLD